MKGDLGVLGALVLMIIIFSASSKFFLERENIFNTLRAFSFIGIAALGQLIVIITGGLDLTAGSVMALSGINAALCMKAGIPIWISIIIGLLTGVIVGTINAFLITKTKIGPIITTLAMLSVVRGLTYVLTKAETIYGLPQAYLNIGGGYVFKFIPIPVIIYFVLAVIVYIFLTKTIWGYEIFAIGGNEVTSRLSGINIVKTKYIAYIISGFLAALGGILLSARLGVAQSLMASGYELDIIAGTIIGGASLVGGVGSVLGNFAGIAIMGVMVNGLVILNVSAYWQKTAIGLIIIAAVLIDQVRKTFTGQT